MGLLGGGEMGREGRGGRGGRLLYENFNKELKLRGHTPRSTLELRLRVETPFVIQFIEWDLRFRKHHAKQYCIFVWEN